MALFDDAEVAAVAAGLLLSLAAVLQPAPERRISEWAEGRIEIPGETGSSRPGKLSWEGFEYLREPLDKLHPDDPARDVTFLGSAQIAKTTVGIIATCYYSAETPRSWAVALPSTDEVLKYNRVKWQPIVDATPELRRKIKPVTSRDEQGSTNTFKRFAGGSGLFFATGSPKALQMVTFCLAVLEETPNWEREVGDRGDPRSQIRRRQLQWEMAGAKTFHNSTPGMVRRSEGEDGAPGKLVGCPVTEDYESGDQRRLYHPCPHCGDHADGAWVRLDWERMQGLGEGQRPHFNCPSCGGEIEHRHKPEMVRRSVWLPTFEAADETNLAPDWWTTADQLQRFRERPPEGRQPSYSAWQVVSAAVDWSYIAKEHRAAEAGEESLKIEFSQQILGRAYELTIAKTNVQELLERRDPTLVRRRVPSGMELLTFAADMNGDWAQWTVYAWGPGAMHCPVDKGRIEGSPSDPKLWDEMAEVIGRAYPHEDGGVCRLEAAGIDSGYGTFHVYSFCNRFSHLKALDGADGWGRMPLQRGVKQRLQGDGGNVVYCRTWRVGTWDLKRTLLNEAIPLSLQGERSSRIAGKAHWPGWLERDFFEELTAEALVSVQDRKTGIVTDEAWVRVRRRNEEMDLHVYNEALARSKGVGVPGSEPDWLELARRRQAPQLGLEALWERPTPAAADPVGEAPSAPPAAPPPAASAPAPAIAPKPAGAGWFSTRSKL